VSPNEPEGGVVSLDGLSITFHPRTPDERIALNDLSLTLAPGDFAVVIGSNGAGKSTLLNVLAGALFPDRGVIRVDGVDVTGWPVHRRAAMISRVFQDPMLGTAPALSIEENLAFAAMRGRHRGFGAALGAAQRKHFAELLAPYGLGLEQRLAAPASLLSGGQRQVLALVMATLASPRILLLDEHTAALDPGTAALVMRATESIITTHQLTALMITHNMRHAIDHGNRLIAMEAGRIKLDIAGPDKADLSVDDLVRRFGADHDHVLLQGKERA